MSERFLLRFNLENHAADEVRARYGAEFDATQTERVSRLRKAFAEELRVLRGKRVLFLGDSITSDNLGYRTSVSRAAELVATDGSVSGATTATLLPLAEARIREGQYDLISVMLGANDSVTLEKEGRGQVSLEEYAANMERILKKAKASGASVLLLGITSVHEERFAKSFLSEGKRQFLSTIARYNGQLRALSQAYGIPFLEHIWQNDDRFLEKDGIHLTPLGQERLSEEWLVAASNIIKERKA